MVTYDAGIFTVVAYQSGVVVGEAELSYNSALLHVLVRSDRHLAVGFSQQSWAHKFFFVMEDGSVCYQDLDDHILLRTQYDRSGDVVREDFFYVY